jgi:hypothetical protein
MKKNLLLIVAIALMAGMFAGCEKVIVQEHMLTGVRITTEAKEALSQDEQANYKPVVVHTLKEDTADKIIAGGKGVSVMGAGVNLFWPGVGTLITCAASIIINLTQRNRNKKIKGYAEAIKLGGEETARNIEAVMDWASDVGKMFKMKQKVAVKKAELKGKKIIMPDKI